MYLYDYNENYYTEKDIEVLNEFLCTIGYRNSAEQQLINYMCDFLILEKIRIKALRTETEPTQFQIEEIERRTDRIKERYIQFKRLYPAAVKYLKIREKCNRVYIEFEV